MYRVSQSEIIRGEKIRDTFSAKSGSNQKGEADGKEQVRRSKPKCGLGKQVSRPKEEWIEVPVPAKISVEDYIKAQERLVMNLEQAKRNTKHKYLMSRRLSRRKQMKCYNDTNWLPPDGDTFKVYA